MDFDEEFDIDSLADLLDGDENFDQTNVSSISSNKILHKEENCETESKTICSKLTPVDLFSQETNTNDSPQKGTSEASLIHSGELDSSDDESKTYLTESGKAIKKRIALTPAYDKRPPKKIKTWKDIEGEKSTFQKEEHVVDEYSGLKIISPLVSRSLMKSRMVGRRMIKMSFISNFMRKGDIDGDWVTIGVLINKLAPKTSKNGKIYSVWKLNDLHDTDKMVAFFLFSDVHNEHWKIPVGSVIGLLNPSFLPDRDKSKNGDLSLSIDHPAKLLLIGTSKDFGTCKGRRKDGTPCTCVVNKSVCEFCSFHVSKEYKKLSGKRIDLQATYSGRQPGLKNRILKGQNVIYGGQMFSSPSTNVDSKPKSKDKLTLYNLKFKKKVEELSHDETEKICSTKFETGMNQNNNPFISQSQFINQQLSIPSVGSRNLQRHLGRDEEINEQSKKRMISVTPKELLKLHGQKLKERLEAKLKIGAVSLPKEICPKLGKGLKPGDEISVEIGSPQTKITSLDVAKVRAIQKIKEAGILRKPNPNAVKKTKSPESTRKIEKALHKDEDKMFNKEGCNSEPVKTETKILLKNGILDINSPKFQEILNRKSSHHYQVNMDEIEKVETYFRNMEKKEQLEQKMLSTTEIVCDVVSCKQCKYTAHHASDFCKNEGHPLKTHKALKRFFICTNCKRRTCSFTKFPTKACKNCGEFNFEKTSMMKPRSGPKLDNEVLNIRGDEIKFLNSLTC